MLLLTEEFGVIYKSINRGACLHLINIQGIYKWFSQNEIDDNTHEDFLKIA